MADNIYLVGEDEEVTILDAQQTNRVIFMNNSHGNEILEHYSKIYRDEFLKQSQQESMEFRVVGGNGCRSNEKDSIRIDQKNFNREEIEMLTT